MELQTQSKYIYCRSLLSSQEFKIDQNENLKISTFSLNNNNLSTVPLELINADPSISKTPNLYAAAVALLSFVSSISIYVLTLEANLFSAQLIASLLLSISIMAFVFSWKKQNSTYTFYYKNTSISIFKLQSTTQNNPQVEEFTQLLSDKITYINKRNSYSRNDMESKFISNLDSLYNHGFINDVIYKNVMARIDHKINGTIPNQDLAEVINFPLRSM